MDQENKNSININTADENALTELNGVGSHLAKLIIDARPFNAIDDLARVSGISEKDVERLRPFLNIDEPSEHLQNSEESSKQGYTDVPEDVLETETSSTKSESFDQAQTIEDADDSEELGDSDEYDGEQPPETSAIVSAEEPDPEDLGSDPSDDEEPESSFDVPDSDDDIPTEVPDKQPNFVTRGGACSLALFGGLITLILAVAFTLGIISSINQGRLNYASPSQVEALRKQNDTLAAQSQLLADDIEGLRSRMDNLEALSGQVSDMEEEIGSIQQELDLQGEQIIASQAAYEELVLKIENVEEEIEALNAQGDRFESFLDGLRALMEELFPQTTEVEETP